MNRASRSMVNVRCMTGLFAAAVVSAWPPSGRGEELKLSHVAMFSSGVAYYQADGAVNGDATAELHFRTSQINDLIKSLVLQDFDGGTIRAVEYPSRDPIEKTLKSFGVDITGKPTLGQLLDQLRGVEVEVAAPTAATGMIVGVDRHKEQVDKTLIEVEDLTILTETGLRSLRLRDVGGIRIRDAKVDGELRKALATLATSHDADKKTVTLSFSGQGQRRLRVSYILEAPIWKTSYRLVLADNKKPYLQGWATVENTTEQDWTDVRLSLVSGRPISFVMDLYTPIYIPRPKVELELYASLRPPEYEGAMEEKAEAAVEGRAAGRRKGLLQAAPRAAAMAEGQMDLGGAAGSSPGDMDLANRGVASVATAERAGELFAYQIQAPVSLKRQQSAMLPIVSGEIDGSKLSIYNPATHAKYPLNGVQIVNSTGLNLMQGPVTVFDGNNYAGDAKLPDLRPNEKRLVSYALDLAVEVELVMQPKPDEVVSLRIAKGTLWYKRKSVDSRTYNLKNKDSKPRTVLIEQPYSGEWTLIEPKEPFERARDVYRFKVDVRPNSNASLTTTLERVADAGVVLASSGLDEIQIYLRARVISPAVRKALEEVVRRRMAIDEVRARLGEAERTVTTIEQEQTRIRENMKALPANSDIVRRYLTKLDAQESQIEQTRTVIAELRHDVEAKQKALNEYLLSLNVD